MNPSDSSGSPISVSSHDERFLSRPSRSSLSRVAIVGAGIAGTACAAALSKAGLSVHVFDKARGPGGRMATRRFEWHDAAGHPQMTPLDHGAIAFEANSSAFRIFVAQAQHSGWLAEWTPPLAPNSDTGHQGERRYVGVPDMPAVCRQLLNGTAGASWSCAVERLQVSPSGWQVIANGQPHGENFDAVILALPPAQAAPLLVNLRSDWARRATVAPMQPCWTLMGVADSGDALPDWDLAWPTHGALGCILRNDTRPSRTPTPGQMHWVAHARDAWSRTHLEASAEWVQAELQAALNTYLGHTVAWRHSTVHRWRYATPMSPPPGEAGQCWWDEHLRLGVCGDFLGGNGVEGAWLSAQTLAAQLLG